MSREQALKRMEQEIAELEQSRTVPEETPAASEETAPETPETPTEQQTPEQEGPKPEDLIAKYKEEAEAAAKRKKEMEAGMTKAFQESAEVKKALKERDDELARLKAELENARIQKETEQLDSSRWEGYDDIGKAVKAELAIERARILAEVEEAKRIATAERDALLKQAEQQKMADHFSRVAAVHNDAADYFNPEKDLARALEGWAHSQAPEYLEAVLNPVSKSPEFVARMLKEFKQEIGLTKKAVKPDLGDIAVQKTATPTTPAKKPELDVFTDAELKRLPQMVAANRGNAEALAAIEAKLERTYKQRR